MRCSLRCELDMTIINNNSLFALVIQKLHLFPDTYFTHTEAERPTTRSILHFSCRILIFNLVTFWLHTL